VQEFIGWPASRQVKYFNEIPQRARMDFLVAMMNEGAEFAMPSYDEIKFLSNGEFIFDRFIDGKGYMGGTRGGKEFRYMKGKWFYKDGKIFLEGKIEGIDFPDDGEVWIDAHAETRKETSPGEKATFRIATLFKGSKEPEETNLLLQDHLNSPAIRSYAGKTEKSAAPSAK
jgi:hypothetical protein